MSDRLNNTLFVVCGKPGTGKSTYGTKLARERGAVIIDLDTCSEPIVEASLRMADYDPKDRDSETYKTHFREPVYQAMFDVASENIPHLPVVVIGPFTREINDPQWCDKLALQYQAPVELHFVTCDEVERYARLNARGNPRDVSKIQNWRDHQQYYEASMRPACPHVLIET